MPFAGKPILGVIGGIASGKSFASRTLSELGCVVIDSDALAHTLYRRPETIATLVDWYGPSILDSSGQVDRRAVAAIVFRDPSQRKRLEAFLHPRINAEREAIMQHAEADASIRAFVWDSPLLIEAGLHTQCDALLFVDVPLEVRQQRVSQSRGWSPAELEQRENAQIALTQKRELATHTIDGTLTKEALLQQLGNLLNELTRRTHA